MLEVSHLSKIYKAKGGEDVYALDDVSVKFPETGMVFLLGKSGSGKSTLLNVCGGLDAPTSGEIIVKGRSSKEFSQSDFDSYRNTFIGFIFQEYNILNEFSVEDNIALALELQGKPKNKAAISALLEEVDLTGLAKRKPNTLSGGQKQRIAIARALVKAPEIIMADEPTGALDSVTGKQVFDTLKKLSKDKLVIVVSHDRDFAELYGDRIIELKDGKIISDVTKTQEKQKSLSANVTVIGDTLCVKKSAQLSDKEFEEIKAFLKGANGDIVIAAGEKDVKTFKEVSRITDNGEKEVFHDTDETLFEKKAYSSEESKFIRSKLPMRHALKIGASGLKTKPFRLIFTVLLSTIAFVMFGLFSTMMLYDKNTTLYQSIDDSNPSVLRITKKYQYTEYDQNNDKLYSYQNEKATVLTQAELDEMSSVFGNDSFGVVYLSKDWGGESGTVSINSDGMTASNVASYYQTNLAFAASLPDSHPMQSKIRSGGKYPTADDEACISSYTASSLVAYGVATDIDGLIGKTFEIRIGNLGTKQFKICGIFDSNDSELSSKYSALKETSSSAKSEENEKLKVQLASELADGLHYVMFVTENMRNTILTSANTSETNPFESVVNYKYQLSFNDENSTGQYFSFGDMPANGKYTFFDSNKTTLSDGEVLVQYNVFSNLLYPYSEEYNEIYNLARNEFENLRNSSFENEEPSDDIQGDFDFFMGGYVPSEENDPDNYQFYLNGYNKFQSLLDNSEYAAVKSQYEVNLVMNKNVTVNINDISFTQSVSQFMSLIFYGGELPYLDKDNNPVSYRLTDEDHTTVLNAILPELSKLSVSFTGKAMQLENGLTPVARGAKELTVVGLILSSGNNYIALSNADYAAYATLSDELNPNYYSSKHWTESKYVEAEDGIFDALYIPYNSSLKGELSMFTFEWAEDDSRYAISHAVGTALENVNDLVENLGTVFMWIGIVMAVFAALLLSNFISVSISHKKRDIGILRAVGARSFDVFKIFFSESFIIAFISIALSMVGCFVTCSIINAEIGSALSGVSLFVFGPVSILILVGVALVTAVIATFLPVYNAAKKKPVESIRAL